jgi:hypothetical protein
LNDLAKAVKRVNWPRYAVVIATLLGSPRARAEQPAPPELEPGENALETYELNALGLIHVGARDEEGSWRPARGKYRRAMSYEDFYRAVGRPELAEEHSARVALSNLLSYTGWGVLLAGGILFFVGFEDGEPQTASWVGAGVAGGGVGFVVAGATMDRDAKLSEPEAEALSADYNAGLRRRLGLGNEPSSLRRSQPAPLSALARTASRQERRLRRAGGELLSAKPRLVVPDLHQVLRNQYSENDAGAELSAVVHEVSTVIDFALRPEVEKSARIEHAP